MNAETAEKLIRSYVEGWCKGDADEILGAVAPDCVVVEAHGPTYRGRDRIAQWVGTWFAAGGEVLLWEIRSLELAGEAACFEWSFACSWQGERYELEGASVVRFNEGRISYIREYATTAPLYDWDGTWR
ncbi:MAG: nuclear transport factor 2 family protein [Gaiellaceae bacterium]